MKRRIFNCVVFAARTKLENGSIISATDDAVYVVSGDDEADVVRVASETYKSNPDKFEYHELKTFALELQAHKLTRLLEGEMLELALKKLEVYDPLNEDILE